MALEERSDIVAFMSQEFVSFDHGKILRYLQLFKEFLRRYRDYCRAYHIDPLSPFDKTVDCSNIPADAMEAIQKISASRSWSPFCQRALEIYVDLVSQPDYRNAELLHVYRPILEFLLEGGEFYEHHGDVQIGDASISRPWRL